VADFSKWLGKLYAISGVHTAESGPENYPLVSQTSHQFCDFMFYEKLVPDR
jgi:hypothetical protein